MSDKLYTQEDLDAAVLAEHYSNPNINEVMYNNYFDQAKRDTESNKLHYETQAYYISENDRLIKENTEIKNKYIELIERKLPNT